MKKPVLFLTFVIGLLLSGCSSNDEGSPVTEPDTLSVNPLSLFFNSGESTAKTVTITTNVDWNANPSVEWIKIVKNGDILSVNVAEFTYAEDTRVGTISITAGEAEAQEITVTQAPKTFEKAVLKVLPESFSFSAKGGDGVIDVVSNVAWDVKTVPDWITYDLNSETNQIHIHTKMNNMRELLSGELILSSAEDVEDAVVAISQEALIFKASLNELTFPAEGGTKHIEIESNIDSWEITYESTWFVAAPSTTPGHDIEVTVNKGEAQARTGNFSISIPELDLEPIVIAVTQAETKFSVDIVKLEFTAEGGSKIVKVDTNLVNWEAEGDGQIWVDFSTDIQKGELSVTVNKNQTTSVRSAVITLKPMGSTAGNIAIAIEQEEGEEPQLPFIWNRTSAEYMNLRADVQSVSYFSDLTYNEGVRKFQITNLVFGADNYLQNYVHTTQTNKAINMAMTYDSEMRIAKISGSTGVNFTIEFTYVDHGKHITTEELLLELARQGGIGGASYILCLPKLMKNLASIKLTDSGASYNNAHYDIKVSGANGSVSKFDNKGNESPNYMVMTFDGDMLNSITYNRYPNDYEAKYNINPVSGVIDTKILLNKTASTSSTYYYMNNVHNRLLRNTLVTGDNVYTYNEQFDLIEIVNTVEGSGTFTYVYDSNNNWTTRTPASGSKLDRTIVYR